MAIGAGHRPLIEVKPRKQSKTKIESKTKERVMEDLKASGTEIQEPPQTHSHQADSHPVAAFSWRRRYIGFAVMVLVLVVAAAVWRYSGTPNRRAAAEKSTITDAGQAPSD